MPIAHHDRLAPPTADSFTAPSSSPAGAWARATRGLAGVLAAAVLVSTAVASGGCVVRGRTSAGVVVYSDPPPPRRVVVAARPGYIWVDGRWDWDGAQWYWVDGYWEAERTGYVYVAGYWQPRGRGRVWVAPTWKRHNGHGKGGVKVKDHTRGRGHDKDNQGPVVVPTRRGR